jgi:hypothetical protein
LNQQAGGQNGAPYSPIHGVYSLAEIVPDIPIPLLRCAYPENEHFRTALPCVMPLRYAGLFFVVRLLVNASAGSTERHAPVLTSANQ